MKDDLVSLGIVALILLAIITLGSSMINGASLLMARSAAVPDPAGLSSSTLKFASALVALIGSVIGIVYLLRLQRPGAFVGLVVLTIFGLLFIQTARTSSERRI
jgi:hypothetical protein